MNLTEYEKLQIEWLKSISEKLSFISGMVGLGVTLYALSLLNII